MKRIPSDSFTSDYDEPNSIFSESSPQDVESGIKFDSPYFGMEPPQQKSMEKEDVYLKQRKEFLADDQRLSLALAFSGGGIRSAAYCHGVLQYLLGDPRYRVECMAGVSGGSFTAGSFVQIVNEYMRVEGLPLREAQRKFFRKGKIVKDAGYLLNFRSWDKALGSILSLLFLAVTWVILFFAEKIPIMFILAAIVEQTWGNQLRREDWASNIQAISLLAAIIVAVVIVWVLLHLAPKKNTTFRVMNALRFVIVSMTFFEMLLLLVRFDFISEPSGTSEVIQIVLLCLALALRTTTKRLFSISLFSLFIYTWFVARVVSWRVFQRYFFVVGEYSDSAFRFALLVSGPLMFLPLGSLHTSLLYHWHKWKLQDSFFKNSGWWGCTGIFPFNCGGYPTTMGELDPQIPQYIGVTTVNIWQPKAWGEQESFLFTIESGGRVRVIDSDPRISKHVPQTEVSTVVTLSAAAIAYRMGEIDTSKYRFWQITFGFGLGYWLLTKREPIVRYCFLFLGTSILSLITLAVAFFDWSPFLLVIPLSIYAFVILLRILLPPNILPWLWYFPYVVNTHQLLSLTIVDEEIPLIPF